jgi:hypothetical protein
MHPSTVLSKFQSFNMKMVKSSIFNQFIEIEHTASHHKARAIILMHEISRLMVNVLYFFHFRYFKQLNKSQDMTLVLL